MIEAPAVEFSRNQLSLVEDAIAIVTASGLDIRKIRISGVLNWQLEQYLRLTGINAFIDNTQTKTLMGYEVEVDIDLHTPSSTDFSRDHFSLEVTIDPTKQLGQ